VASKTAKNTTIKSRVVEHLRRGGGREWKRIEDGGGCGDDDNNACIAYDDRANKKATKASPDRGVQGKRNQQSKWSSAWRGGGGACAKMTITTMNNDETQRKKYITTNHKQWKDATGNRGGERWR
jgi:hypothetical protein